MTKINILALVKKILIAISRVLLIILVSATLLIGVLHNARVQSALAKVSSTILTEKLGVNVWIERILISSYFDVVLENVNIFDHKDQPIITAKKIELVYNIFRPVLSEIPVNSVVIDSAYVNLTQYIGDEALNINMLFSDGVNVNDSLIEQDTLNVNQDSDVFQLGLDYLSIQRSHFIYHVQMAEPYEVEGMDYQDLDVTDITLEIENVHMVNDSIAGQIITLQAKEKCGIVLKHLEAFADVSPRHLILKDAQIITPNSNAKLDLTFNYDSWYAYLDFINEVSMLGDIKPSKVNMEDIAYFAPAMFGMDNSIRLQGEVKGFVRNLKGKNLHLAYGKSTSFNGTLQLTGLPDIYETFIKLKVKDFSTSIKDLGKFKLPDGEIFDSIPQSLAKFGLIRLKGKYTGFYNDFVSNLTITSEMGRLETDIRFMNNNEEDIVYYKGDFKAINFDIGSYIDMEDVFGDINFSLDVEGKGLRLSDVETKVNGEIENLVFKGNELNTIFIDAFIKENQFNGKLGIRDRLINASFLGVIDFDSINPKFDFKTRLDAVKLARLGLLDVDATASLSTSIHMNFKGASIDSFEGLINIDSTKFDYMGANYSMDSLHLLSSFKDKHNKIITLSSDFINGDIEGDFNLSLLPNSMDHILHSFIHQLHFIDYDTNHVAKQEMDYHFTISNTQKLSELFIPELILKDSLVIKGSLHTETSQLQFDAKANAIKFGGLHFISPAVKLNGYNDAVLSNLYIDEFVFKEESKEDTLRLGIDSLVFDSKLFADSLLFAVNWKNKDNHKAQNDGEISGDMIFSKDKGFTLTWEKLRMHINDSLWVVNKGSSLHMDTVGFVFNHILFSSNNQSVLFDGALSHIPEKSFLAEFKNFNISIFDILTAQSGIDFDGFLSGRLQVVNAYHQPKVIADLNLKSLMLNNEDLGKAEIHSSWESDESIHLNVDLVKRGNKGEYKPFYLKGYYYPLRDKNQIDLDLSVKHLSLNFLTPFLEEFVSDLEGKATGDIRIKGQILAPDLSGKLDLERTQFRIKYLNTLYSLSGSLNINNNTIGFDQVSIYDTLGHSAKLQGGLTHNRLSKFGVDLKINADNFVGLSTRKGMNELFYGKAVITGDVTIKGPFDNIFLDIDASSKQGTEISIPISTSLDVSDNEYIVFVQKDDTVKELEHKVLKPQLSSFSLNMDLVLTPDARVEIFLPSQLGNIQAVGEGALNMNLSRNGNFSLSGDYKVSKGSFFFKLRNLFNRKFSLNEGGSISWTGDPYTGVLNMSANYQVKTNMSSLGLEQDSSYRSRIPVDCIIGLSGPIMNPNVKFRFEFPNATEEVKQYVYTKIDTTNSAEMSQQMLSLLVLNSFSFNNANSSANFANSIGGSSLQIVANQLGNWLSQMSKDVDIGINYRPGTDITAEEVEVALSTQLFDDRVTVDGNFGYQSLQNNPSSRTSSIVGDINVEVKITKDGRLRLKAFNRTNTVDLLDNTSPYTQGIGIFYRKEFNNLRELFQTKKQKEKWQEKEIEKLKAIKKEEVSETSDEKPH